jgi:tRNA (guanine37-N1)-methyltransferase
VRIEILSLFPEYFRSPFEESILKRAREAGIIDIHLVNIRDYSEDRHRRVDDRPYGGGPGMVLTPGPVAQAIRAVKRENSWVVYLSPQGKPLNATKCRELAQKEHLILLCGHYEGIDERIFSDVNEEISIGDYVLTNGCVAALVVLDATVRFLPGVLGHELAAQEDSFENGILDCPHFTRPENFEGKQVPQVLLSGDHKRIAEWRRDQALKKTTRSRPDLLS